MMLMIALLFLPLLAADMPRPQVGEPTPVFQARTLVGKEVRTASLQGQVTVVDFFASWCQPCKEGLAEILSVRQKLDSRFKLMIVAVEGDTPALRAYLASHPLAAEITVVLDGKGALARAFGEDRLPTTYFLDNRAIIRHINRGHGSGYQARATRWLTEMLATGP
jgi:cytochrome c biogenesis protein CcmG, thiol:disulfide interchange protein DsbE